MDTKLDTNALGSVYGNEAKFHQIMRNIIEFIARVLVVVLFLFSGIGKITAYSATIVYMASAGVPSLVLPLVIIIELLGSIAIIVGWQTRVIAVLLAGYTLMTAFFFHANFADQTQMLMFMKNISIAGAFLLLAVHGAGLISIDKRKRK